MLLPPPPRVQFLPPETESTCTVRGSGNSQAYQENRGQTGIMCVFSSAPLRVTPFSPGFRVATVVFPLLSGLFIRARDLFSLGQHSPARPGGTVQAAAEKRGRGGSIDWQLRCQCWSWPVRMGHRWGVGGLYMYNTSGCARPSSRLRVKSSHLKSYSQHLFST